MLSDEEVELVIFAAMVARDGMTANDYDVVNQVRSAHRAAKIFISTMRAIQAEQNKHAPPLPSRQPIEGSRT